MAEDTTFAEVKRLLDADRERDASSFVQRQGESSLGAYLEKCFTAKNDDAWLLDQWFRTLWHANEFPAIRAALGAPARGHAEAMREAWEVLLAARQHDEAGLESMLVKVVRSTASLGDFPVFLEREMASLRSLRPLDAALEAAVADDTVGMSFAALHTRRACHRKQWEVRQHFPRWIERAGDAAAEPVAAFLEVVGDMREAASIVPPLIAEHGPWMRAHTMPYGKCGYALANSGMHAETVQWLDGCEKRDDLAGWIAANLVVALWRRHCYAEAGDVASVVVQRGLRDTTWDWNVAAAAYAHALAARTAECQQALDVYLGDGAKHLDFAWAAEFARSVLRALKLPRSEARRVFDEERQRLRRMMERQTLVNVDAVGTRERYRLTLQAMARRGGFRVWPWQARVSIRSSAPGNPLVGRFWIGGTLLLLLALLRGCLQPGDSLIIDQGRAPKSQDVPAARPATEKEINKVLSSPTGTR